MARLIGTAGHVDHGKTSLIQALTGIDADRLPEEKRRGMTIDLGFAFLELPGVGQVSIVDVPGHERFLANMLVGALGVDVALLCVAADEGPKPQTEEHLRVLDLLPIESMVVALTRSDLAEPGVLELSTLLVRNLLETTRFGDAPIVPVSAITREGIPELQAALTQALSSKPASKGGNWYLPVDRSFLVKGQGVVVTGTLMQGQLTAGEQAELQPQGSSVKIRGVQRHEHDESDAEFGMRTAVRLGGVELEEVPRGCILAKPGTAFATQCMDLAIRWLEAPKHMERVRLSVGADEVMGRLIFNEEDPDNPQVRLERATAAVTGQPFILRSYSPSRVLGGGRVRVVMAERRRKNEDAAALDLNASIEERVVAAIANEPRGVKTEAICRVVGMTPQQLGDIFEGLLADGRLLGFAGLWFSPEAFSESTEHLERTLLEWHAAHPTESGAPREIILREARLNWAEKPLNRILSALAEGGRLRVEGNKIAHVDFAVQLNARQETLLQRVEAVLNAAGFSVPGVRTLTSEVHVPPQAIEEILKVGVQAKRLLRVEEEMFYTIAQLAEVQRIIQEIEGSFSASEFKDKLQTSRKYAIPLLEYCDSRGWTRRQGDVRVAVQRPS